MKKRTWKQSLWMMLAVLLAALVFCVSGCGSSKKSDGLADGTYTLTVSLEGGSGRASIASPTEVTVKKGKITAVITWSSPNYDYMIVDGTKYTPEDYDGAAEHSRFTIPISAFDTPQDVTADTTAMSQPHEIAYKITVHLHSDAFSENASARDESLSSGSNSETENVSEAESEDTVSVIEAAAVPEPSWKTFSPDGYSFVETEKNDYAEHFQITKLKDTDGHECTLLSFSDDSHYLVVSDEEKSKAGEAEKNCNCTILEAPLKNGYLAATSAAAHFVSLDALDCLTYVGATTNEWSIDELRDGLSQGTLRYAGSYSAPQYEQLVKNSTSLAIESTMILHTPAVREKLEELGIPVMMDLSSYENDPMGRAEWIKVYGVLTGKEKQAQRIFSKEEESVRATEEDVQKSSASPRTVAFFYIDSQGRAVVRKTDDYIPKMISMAGGKYIFKDLKSKNPASKSGSVTLTLEEFYAEAKDADILIYNAAIEAPASSIRALTKKSPALADFKAVKNGDVWVAKSSMYQAADSTADIIRGIHEILADGTTASTFFTKIK